MIIYREKMSLDFVSIDFETANYARASVCAVGVTSVEGGEIVSTESWLIKPPTSLDFTNTYIHRITPAHVANAPSWEWTLERLIAIAGSRPLVAYSPFDKGVYNAANKVTGLTPAGLVFLDASALVRIHVDLDKYSLPLVVKHFGLPDFAHHDAAADSLACARVVLHIAAERDDSSTVELWKDASKAKVSRTPTRTYRKIADLPQAHVDADPTHPLFGEVVCFSGDLDSHTRPAAQSIVAALGATVSANVTKKTSLVVMGGFDPATLRAGATLSSKVLRAQELAIAGQGIEIISEEAFLELLEL
jgi:DNA polymerase-3 subunit epsilon